MNDNTTKNISVDCSNLLALYLEKKNEPLKKKIVRFFKRLGKREWRYDLEEERWFYD